MQKFNDEQYLRLYKQKVQDFEKWIVGRTLCANNLKTNEFIDARDTEFIWCKAKIIEIIHKKGKIAGLLVHYEGWNSIYD